MVVLPFDLLLSAPEDPVGVGREWGVEGVVGRCAWGDSAPSDSGEAGERGERWSQDTHSLIHTCEREKQGRANAPGELKPATHTSLSQY